MRFEKGHIPWNKGNHCSEETKRKISKNSLRQIPWNKNLKAKYWNKDWLYEEYIVKKLSTIEIGKLCGVTMTPIRKALIRFNIPRRSRREIAMSFDITGENNPNYKNGKHTQKNGYVRVLINRNNIFAPMRDNKGYILEHRLVMAKHLRKCLEPWEIIHHINGIKNDNRIENLILIDGENHNCFHKQIEELKKEVKELKELLLLIILAQRNDILKERR